MSIVNYEENIFWFPFPFYNIYRTFVSVFN